MDATRLIEEAGRLSERATPGPWRVGTVHAAEEVWAAYPEGLAGLASERLLLRLNPNFTSEQDTTFIARARTLVPDLAAALKASEERARKAEDLAAANRAANKRIVELEHERDAARAELARLTTPRPIAEAPRDGTPVIGIYPDETLGIEPEVIQYEKSDDDAWCWVNCVTGLESAASHYLPLPEVKP